MADSRFYGKQSRETGKHDIVRVAENISTIWTLDDDEVFELREVCNEIIYCPPETSGPDTRRSRKPR